MFLNFCEVFFLTCLIVNILNNCKLQQTTQLVFHTPISNSLDSQTIVSNTGLVKHEDCLLAIACLVSSPVSVGWVGSTWSDSLLVFYKKTNMESTHGDLEDVCFLFKNWEFQVPCEISGVYLKVL